MLTAIFVLFGSFGLIGLQMSAKRASTAAILLQIAFSGGFAIGYAGLFMAQRFRYVPALVVAQVVIERLVSREIGASPSLAGQPEMLHRQLILLGSMSMLGILVAYSLMINFLRVEGRKYVQARTEIALASEIHSSLVPVCSANYGRYEIYGASVPSGDVGGDLVDIVEQPEGWIGYVADVSGHGVQSGVLMAMFKAVLRGQTPSGGSLATMLGQVHGTLFPLKLRNMFVTVGALRAGADGKVQFALAGHPPILHYQRANGAVREYPALDAPLGIMEEQEFSESEIRCEPGDLLLVLTDGLTEVFDKKGKEMGMEVLKQKLQQSAELPLADLFRQLRKTAADFGTQVDDQTVLLVRYKDRITESLSD